MIRIYDVIRVMQGVAPEKLEEILRSGVDANAHDNHKDSLLSHALRVYMTDDYDPDTLACIPRNPQALRQVEILLEHGADVNAPIFMGNTPLHFAVARGGRKADKPLLELLVRHGADPSRRNSHHHTPLDLFRGSEAHAYIEELIKGRRAPSAGEHSPRSSQKPMRAQI